MGVGIEVFLGFGVGVLVAFTFGVILPVGVGVEILSTVVGVGVVVFESKMYASFTSGGALGIVSDCGNGLGKTEDSFVSVDVSFFSPKITL